MPEAPTPEVLLVHGSCHGAWCWRDVLPELAARGIAAKAIDLPGHGADRTPLGEVTLERYAEAILAALDGPTVVVGHSMAGYPISRAADRDPARIARLVYLAAYVPADGLSLADRRRQAPRQPILKALDRSADGQSFRVRPEHAREVFFHDCDEAALAFALDHLGPQPVAPQETPLDLGANWQGVPRSYIVCEEDGAVPTEFQRVMAAETAPRDTHALAGSHSPFLARPGALAALLARIVHDSPQD